MLGKKTGGRQKGTPNHPNPLKIHVARHSRDYFLPSITLDAPTADALGLDLQRLCAVLGAKPGDTIARVDIDLALMDPHQRVDAEIKLLSYHMPKMQAISADISVADDTLVSISQRLAELSQLP